MDLEDYFYVNNFNKILKKHFLLILFIKIKKKKKLNKIKIKIFKKNLAVLNGKPSVILMDRGVMDPKAYMDDTTF